MLGQNIGRRSYPEAALITLTYVGNWFQAAGTLGLLSHTWSLAIEEQYYVLWPVLLMAWLRGRRSTRLLAAVLVSVAIAVSLLRFIVFSSGLQALAALSTVTRTDGVILGSALGLALSSGESRLHRLLSHPFSAAVGGAAVMATALLVRWNSPYLYRGGLTLANLGTCLVIGHLVVRPQSFSKRLLSLQPLPSIGRISYGIYLFHVPINYLVHNWPRRWSGPASVVAMFGMTLAVSIGSYFVVERPALKLKRRFGSNDGTRFT